MSRTGKSAIIIPDGVTIDVKENNIVINGQFGKFEHVLQKEFSVEIKDKKLLVINNSEKTEMKKFHGLNRSLIANKILGVHKPYRKVLLTQGVGYRFQITENKIGLSVGFSHPVEFHIPKGISGTVEGNTKIIFISSDKELLGQFCATIRAVRPPEPYKGKGIRYENEIILRKVGKAGK